MYKHRNIHTPINKNRNAFCGYILSHCYTVVPVSNTTFTFCFICQYYKSQNSLRIPEAEFWELQPTDPNLQTPTFHSPRRVSAFEVPWLSWALLPVQKRKLSKWFLEEVCVSSFFRHTLHRVSRVARLQLPRSHGALKVGTALGE